MAITWFWRFVPDRLITRYTKYQIYKSRKNRLNSKIFSLRANKKKSQKCVIVQMTKCSRSREICRNQRIPQFHGIVEKTRCVFGLSQKKCWFSHQLINKCKAAVTKPLDITMCVAISTKIERISWVRNPDTQKRSMQINKVAKKIMPRFDVNDEFLAEQRRKLRINQANKQFPRKIFVYQ